jgi:inhibitor of cysteine peptidase
MFARAWNPARSTARIAAPIVAGVLGWLAVHAADAETISGAEGNRMSPITLTGADQRKTVDLRVGDVVILRLEENVTTGYRWAIGSGGGDVVALQSSEHVQSPGSAIGGGGERVFSFKGTRPGVVAIQLKLWREWEGDKSISRTFVVTLRVRE